MPATPAPAPAMPRRVAMLSVHTSPLDLPGTGDAGGMNVYVVELAQRLSEFGVEVEVFTRATSSEQPPIVRAAPGVTVRHVMAGPYEALPKAELPAVLCAFTSGVLRAEAAHVRGHYDLVHSHYWLSGQVGWLAAERWGVPLIHSMHTMSRVKNLALASGDQPEPRAREVGEDLVVASSDAVVANTDDEADQLVDLYGAARDRVATVPPGVDLEQFTPGDRGAARARLGLPADAVVLLFAGRIQPLKAPDVLVRAAAELLRSDPSMRERLVVAVVGGASGTGMAEPHALPQLAHDLGIGDLVRFYPPVDRGELADWFRSADVTAVPSYNESFGLVALESQACGTPVVAASVGGLRTAVADGVSGVLVDGHEPAAWAAAVAGIVGAPERRRQLSAGAVAHAAHFGWDHTAARMLDVYAWVRARHRSEALGKASGMGA